MLTGLAQAKIDAASRATEHYLGVLVKDAPYELAPGQNADVMFVLMYWPDESYDNVVPGATFTMREGPLIVGFGHIISASAG